MLILLCYLICAFVAICIITATNSIEEEIDVEELLNTSDYQLFILLCSLAWPFFLIYEIIYFIIVKLALSYMIKLSNGIKEIIITFKSEYKK